MTNPAENLTLEKLEAALYPYRQTLRVERFVRAVADAPAVEVKTSINAEPGTLMALDPRATTDARFLRGDEPVYVLCHPDDEGLAHEVILTVRRATA